MLKDVSITKIQQGGAKTIKTINDYAVIRRGDEELGMVLSVEIASYLLNEGILDQVCEEIYEKKQKDIVKLVREARENKNTKETIEFDLNDYAL